MRVLLVSAAWIWGTCRSTTVDEKGAWGEHVLRVSYLAPSGQPGIPFALHVT